LQRFTPRTAKSGWSKINSWGANRGERRCVRPVAAAKKDGRWDAADA
jgi:hypothetical protein